MPNTSSGKETIAFEDKSLWKFIIFHRDYNIRITMPDASDTEENIQVLIQTESLF